jgi:hypothetical protein
MIRELFISFIFVVFFGYVFLGWIQGCGETYVDSQGHRHEYECKSW